ncbi:hypothetical protein CEF21_10970 [Bacillus sp. FJAT-42376]|nr:hypothetical protein CEF21_10970 [Bacillus sp. FJAT-42376]
MLLAAVIGPALFLSSCTPPGLMFQSAGSAIHTKDKVILFFSDQKKMEDEEQYYDALLAIKDQYPEDYEKMRVYQDDKKNPFGISTYPSLLVINNQKVVVHIEGNVQSKEEILKPLTKVLQN